MALTLISNNNSNNNNNKQQQQRQKRNKKKKKIHHHHHPSGGGGGGGGGGIVTVFVIIIFLVLLPLIIEKTKLNLSDNFLPPSSFDNNDNNNNNFLVTTKTTLFESELNSEIIKAFTKTNKLPSIKPGGEKKGGGASSSVADTDTSVIIKSNPNNAADLIIWVNTNNFDNGFIVAEKYVDFPNGRKNFKRFTEVKEYEIRKCSITSTVVLSKEGGGGPPSNNTTTTTTLLTNTTTTTGIIPVCPTKFKSISRNEYILKICYDDNDSNKNVSTTTSKGGGRIPKIQPVKMIVGIEDAATTTTKSSDTNSNEMKFLGYRNIEISYKNCPIKCNEEYYKFDEIDRLCKSTVPTHLQQRRYAGNCDYETTCFTPDAVQTNSTWPWPSLEYKSKFYNPKSQIWIRDQKLKTIWKQQRIKTQPYEMRFICNNTKSKSKSKKEKEENKNATATKTSSNNNQVSSSLLLPELAYGSFQHHLFYIPQGKLIFCGIPKGGITEWTKFARYTMGANDYLSLPHYKSDREEFFISKLTRHKASELLLNKSKNWTLAIFFRDPAERLLSAYQNKIVNEGYTQGFFKIYNGTDGFWKKKRSNKDGGDEQQYVLSFREFVNLVTYDNSHNLTDLKGLSGIVDPHWQPQSMMCGMDYLLPYVDFIGNFNHIAQHTKQLLEKVGLWDNYGSKFDPADDGILKNVKIGTPKSAVPPPWMFRNKNSSNYTIAGFNQLGPTSTTGHTTKSSTKMDEYYNTPDLLEKVRIAYKYDYEIWDDINNIQNRSSVNNNIITGNDLNIVKTYCKIS